ncbi:cytochrome c oxidase assembly protein [Frondihabitans australicus]|uniref:Putative copper resistance protein D n=1 Tax=Frondihabitans australicus TaxID=386892 RepID=A0A495IJ59_9MICO|nr:cytochrome c oxidase assembly protein [Frondihabitans australicus]RKR76052.1 putative copper resistance protein D [Frondihabitans australicus]
MPRLLRLAGPALLVAAGLAALLVALAYGGAAARLPLDDPGAVVRFGLPVATLVTDLSASLAIGTLALTCFALTPDRPEWTRALDIASAGALAWTIGSCVTGFFTFLSVSNVALTPDAKFGQSLAFFLTNTSLGVAWLVSTLIAAVVTVLCFAIRSPTGVLVVALLAGAGLVPIASQGHAAGTTDHVAAVTALGLHVEGAAVWLGGLLAIVLLRPVLDRRVATVLSRYSTLALLCFAIVTVSGVVSAGIRIGSWADVGSRYGVLVLAKAVALVLLGLFGVVHRRVVITKLQGAGSGSIRGVRSPRLREGTPAFWRFVVAELAVLGVASGVAAALARTSTPVSQKAIAETGTLSPFEVLTGRVLPAPFTVESWFTGWSLDLVWLLGCAVLAVVYVVAVRRVRRRGETWPWSRAVLWILGLVVLAYMTSGAPHLYDQALISAHLGTVVCAGLVVPALLVPAAPWTLALVAIDKRTDGSRGPREWLLGVVRSRVAAWLTHPFTGPLLASVSLWAWLHTPLLRWSVATGWGHFAMVLELVLAGWLCAQAVCGIDPVPVRAGRGLAVGGAALVAVVVVGLGVRLLGDGLLLSNWYGATGRQWGLAPVDDQQAGGVVLMVAGLVVGSRLVAAAVRRPAE